jgi:hypothetical protein
MMGRPQPRIVGHHPMIAENMKIEFSDPRRLSRRAEIVPEVDDEGNEGSWQESN